MKLLIFGKNGQLGHELERAFTGCGQVIALDTPEVDFLKADSVSAAIQTIKPELIINAAAFTNVEKAEAEPDAARQVNAFIPGLIARYARKIGAALIHYSTDYVFDGTKGAPYLESDIPNPMNVYGRSKLEGEQLVQQARGAYLILRTSWVYSMRGAGFFNKVLQWSRSQETMRVVDDQVGSPTWARVLAQVTGQLVNPCLERPFDFIQPIAGVYHAAGAGFASRFQWAQAILENDPRKSEQVVKQLMPAKTSEFPSAVVRPHNSSLSNDKLTAMQLVLPNWRESIRECLLDQVN